MNWIELSLQTTRTPTPQFNPQHYKKFTIYEHNQTSTYDPIQQKFTSMYNCKKLNRHFSTIGLIEGDLKHCYISISCSLLNQMMMANGRWIYQRTQLLRFAEKYNQRASCVGSTTGNGNGFVVVKVNPQNGQVCVAIEFMVSPILVRDGPEKLKEVITDYANKVADQSEKIFNTIIEIIYCKEANEPYLKSSRANTAFPPHIKNQKLLDKVRPLIATSNFYEIRQNITKANKQRSVFKKMYLTYDAKVKNNPMVYQLARVYEMKFLQSFEENQGANNGGMNQLKKQFNFIKRYQDIQEKYQMEFAKHLALDDIQEAGNSVELIDSLKNTQDLPQNGPHHKQKLLVLQSGQQIHAHIQQVPKQYLNHQLSQLTKLAKKHPNIVQYYRSKSKNQNLRITEAYTIPLQEYLRRNKQVLGLISKLEIMCMICHVVQYLHSQKKYCMVKMENFVMGTGWKVKLRGLERMGDIVQSGAYVNSVAQLNNTLQLPDREFPYVNVIDKKLMESQKGDVHSLGTVLYRILMEKFPFFQHIQRMNDPHQTTTQDWEDLWVVQTQSFMHYGGHVAKLLANLLLKCINSSYNQNQKGADKLKDRPYVEWITVIIYEIHHSLQGLL